MSVKEQLESLFDHFDLKAMLMEQFKDNHTYGGIFKPILDDLYECPICGELLQLNLIQEHCNAARTNINEHLILSVHGL